MPLIGPLKQAELRSQASSQDYNDNNDAIQQAFDGSGVLTDDASAGPIVVQHTFDPTTPQAPFLLGANAQGQTVEGLAVDTVDGLSPVHGVGAQVIHPDIALVATGDGIAYLLIPNEYDGLRLTKIFCGLSLAGAGGLVTIQVHNATTGNDMLSTPATIDSGELTTETAATPPVVNPSFETVSGLDRLRIDLDTVRTVTDAEGLHVLLQFEV